MGMDSKHNNISGEHVLELVSAYIDKSLEAGEMERVRAHIATCEVCGAELRELQATQQMLRALPVQVPPRVFTLTEEMAGARSRPAATSSLLSRLFGRALAPRLATGSVLAFALLLVMLVSDLGLAGRGAMAPIANTGAKLATESETEEAPPQRSMAGPTSTTAMAEMLPMVAPTTAAVLPNVGGGDANATPVPVDQANSATPQATTMSQAADATSTTGTTSTEATEEGQAANAPTAQDAAGDQAAGTGAEGTTTAYYSERTPPEGDESVSGLVPVAQSPSPGGTAMSVTLIIELGLALLGVGLAIGAILARRKRA